MPMTLQILDATLLQEVLILIGLVTVRTQLRALSLVGRCPRRYGLISFAGGSAAVESYTMCCVCPWISLLAVIMSFVLIQVGEF